MDGSIKNRPRAVSLLLENPRGKSSRVARAARLPLLARDSCSAIFCPFSPRRIFEQKRDCSQSTLRKKQESILQIQHHSKHPTTKFTKAFPIFLHSCASTTYRMIEKSAMVNIKRHYAHTDSTQQQLNSPSLPQKGR